MSDLDFDELDKAVNTLMGDVPKVDPSKNDEVKTLNINATLPQESRPSLSNLDSELTKVNESSSIAATTPTATAPAPVPSLAARRGGRFMDVVHPSSDMKGVAKSPNVTSRQGVTIEPTPVAPAGQSTAAGGRMDVASTAQNVSDAASDATIDAHATSGDDWPDPLDMNNFSAEPDTSSSVQVIDGSPAEALPVVDELEDEADQQPLVSPFLPDAKVEKRPLGGAPVEETQDEEEKQEVSPVHDEPGRAPALGVVAADDIATADASEQLPVNPAEIERPLPPELQSDLMAIETDGGTSALASNVTATDGAPSVVSSETKPSAPVVTPGDQKPVGGSVATASAVTGPTSIPQQYHEEPTTSDQTNGAIYDTDSYHQPLAHPAKTKSGWLWIIWILLLLMVGGGGAVALYFLGII